MDVDDLPGDALADSVTVTVTVTDTSTATNAETVGDQRCSRIRPKHPLPEVAVSAAPPAPAHHPQDRRGLTK